MPTEFVTTGDGVRIAYNLAGQWPALMLLHSAGKTRKDWHRAGSVAFYMREYGSLTLQPFCAIIDPAPDSNFVKTWSPPMTTLTQGSHPQIEAWQLIQQAAATVAGCFPAFRDQFLTHCPVIQVRAANREKHNIVREL